MRLSITKETLCLISDTTKVVGGIMPPATETDENYAETYCICHVEPDTERFPDYTKGCKPIWPGDQSHPLYCQK